MPIGFQIAELKNNNRESVLPVPVFTFYNINFNAQLKKVFSSCFYPSRLEKHRYNGTF